MSYRISIVHKKGKYHQLFGNNEDYLPFKEELERQGCNTDADGDGYIEGFQIKELQPIIDTLIKYLEDKDEYVKSLYNKSIWDFTPNNKKKRTVDIYIATPQRECLYIPNS